MRNTQPCVCASNSHNYADRRFALTLSPFFIHKIIDMMYSPAGCSLSSSSKVNRCNRRFNTYFDSKVAISFPRHSLRYIDDIKQAMLDYAKFKNGKEYKDVYSCSEATRKRDKIGAENTRHTKSDDRSTRSILWLPSR